MLLDVRTLSLFFIPPLLSVILVFNEVRFISASACKESELSSCMEGLNPSANKEELTFPLTEEELVKMCGELQKAMKCVNSYTSRCFDPGQMKFYKVVTGGAIKLMSDLCTRGTPFRRKYLKHAGCYKYLPAEYKRCADDYTTELEFVKHLDLENDEREQKLCCLFNGYKQCARSAILSKCNPEAADMGESIVTMVSGPLVELQCARYKLDSPYCSSASAIRIPAIMLIFTLMIIFAKKLVEGTN